MAAKAIARIAPSRIPSGRTFGLGSDRTESKEANRIVAYASNNGKLRLPTSSQWPASLRHTQGGCSQRKWKAGTATKDAFITREEDRHADVIANDSHPPVVFLKDMTFEELEV